VFYTGKLQEAHCGRNTIERFMDCIKLFRIIFAKIDHRKLRNRGQSNPLSTRATQASSCFMLAGNLTTKDDSWHGLVWIANSAKDASFLDNSKFLIK
jgi:hypothetical protein